MHIWQPAGNQGQAYRRQRDVADHPPFVVALAAAFDRGVTRKETGGRLVLALQADGTLVKPTVTLQQLAAVSFKVMVPSHSSPDAT